MLPRFHSGFSLNSSRSGRRSVTGTPAVGYFRPPLVGRRGFPFRASGCISPLLRETRFQLDAGSLWRAGKRLLLPVGRILDDVEMTIPQYTRGCQSWFFYGTGGPRARGGPFSEKFRRMPGRRPAMGKRKRRFAAEALFILHGIWRKKRGHASFYEFPK